MKNVHFGLVAYMLGLGFAQAAPVIPDLFVGSSFTSAILRYNGITGAFEGPFVTPGSGGLDITGGFTWNQDGTLLYVGSRMNKEILRYNGETGAFIDVFVTSGSGGL